MKTEAEKRAAEKYRLKHRVSDDVYLQEKRGDYNKDEWKEIPGLPGYEISIYGDVYFKGDVSGKLRRKSGICVQHRNRLGYITVHINGKIYYKDKEVFFHCCLNCLFCVTVFNFHIHCAVGVVPSAGVGVALIEGAREIVVILFSTGTLLVHTLVVESAFKCVAGFVLYFAFCGDAMLESAFQYRTAIGRNFGIFGFAFAVWKAIGIHFTGVHELSLGFVTFGELDGLVNDVGHCIHYRCSAGRYDRCSVGRFGRCFAATASATEFDYSYQ